MGISKCSGTGFGRHLVTILTQLCLGSALAQSFQKVDLGCAPNQSGANCAKAWSFSGGPGYVGDRTTTTQKLFCSPSCTDTSNPKVCSLILAFHGAGQNAEGLVRILHAKIAFIVD